VSSAARTPSNQTSSDLGDVEEIARNYIDGWYSGNVTRMDRSLHTELVKRTPDDKTSGLRDVSKARMLELTATGGGKVPDAETRVIVDDISDGIASARVLSPDYVDYLHLVETPDGWKIANVLFRGLS
jgi:hypothetical protein